MPALFLKKPGADNKKLAVQPMVYKSVVTLYRIFAVAGRVDAE